MCENQKNELYRCEYCKGLYKTPVERAKCEQSCFERMEEHRKEAERKMRMLKHDVEHKQIEAELGELLEKIYHHQKEYGEEFPFVLPIF